MNIKDFSCSHNSGSGTISPQLAREKKLKFPLTYENWELMETLALLKKEESKSSFCLLPFCTSLEAEAFGGDVVFSNSLDVPRISNYKYSSLEQILNIPSIDLTNGRIDQVLRACKSLSDKGEITVLEVSGPITILANLLDIRLIMKSWRKDRDRLFQVFNKLGDFIVDFSQMGLKSGVNIICYADPTGSYSILGPKFSEELAIEIVLPILKRIQAILSPGHILHVCPKTSSVLVGFQLANWKEKKISNQSISYDQACSQSINYGYTIGENCIKNKDYYIKNGNIKILEIH